MPKEIRQTVQDIRNLFPRDIREGYYAVNGVTFRPTQAGRPTFISVTNGDETSNYMLTDDQIIGLDDTMLANEDSLPLNPDQAEELQTLLGSRVNGRLAGSFISDVNIQQQMAADARLAASLDRPSAAVQGGAQATRLTRLEIEQEEARVFTAALGFFNRALQADVDAQPQPAAAQERPSTTFRPMQAFLVNVNRQELGQGNLVPESVTLVFDRARQIGMGGASRDSTA